MAQRRPLIKSVEEVNCINCVFGSHNGNNVSCRRDLPTKTATIIHPPETFWCGEGQWFVCNNSNVPKIECFVAVMEILAESANTDSDQAHVLVHTDRAFFCGNWEKRNEFL